MIRHLKLQQTQRYAYIKDTQNLRKIITQISKIASKNSESNNQKEINKSDPRINQRPIKPTYNNKQSSIHMTDRDSLSRVLRKKRNLFDQMSKRKKGMGGYTD